MSSPALTAEAAAAFHPAATTRVRSGLGALAVAALALAAYANTLGHGLVYDDPAVVALNEAARNPLDLHTIFATPSWFATGHPTIAYRPFTTWTFALGYATHGLNPFGYHLVNVLLHAGVSALVVLVGVALGMASPVAAVAGALFAVHPVHTEVVASVVGRAELLAAAFGLLALWAAVSVPGPVGVAAALVAYAAALLSKEHAVALLVVIPLAGVALQGGRRRSIARRLPLWLGLAAVTAGYLWLRAEALGGIVGAPGAIGYWMNPAASAPAPLRVLTAFHVLALACWRLVAPFHLAADYSFDAIPVASSVLEPGVLAGIACALGIGALAVALWRRSRAGFVWLALAVVSYGIVSNFVLPIGTIFGERLLYLPSVGFCALLAMALLRPAAQPRGALALVALALVVVWGARTALRNPVWRSELSFGEQLVRDAPASGHAHHVLGTIYSQQGRDDDALRQFDVALRIQPEDTASLYNAGVIYQRRSRLDEALAVFARVTAIDPGYFPAWINRASVNNLRGRFTPALESAERAVAIKPEVPNAHVVKGFALRGLQRHDEARAAFEAALRLAPTMPEALLGLGANAVDQRDFAVAAGAFEQLVEVAPVNDAWRGLVYSYRQLGRTEDAERAAATARLRFPNDAFFQAP